MIFGIHTTSDISKLLYVISRAVRRVKFETILKYHEWYLCQISRTNHAIICFYKITKIVRALWLAKRRIFMRVRKHGCDVKMFCFPRANHASTNLKKVLSWKTRRVYFIYPFPRQLKLEKSLETCWVHLFLLDLTF